MEKTFYSGEVVQNQLVSCVKFDSWFAIDTFCVEVGAELTFWSGTVASCFSKSTYLALDR